MTTVHPGLVFLPSGQSLASANEDAAILRAAHKEVFRSKLNDAVHSNWEQHGNVVDDGPIVFGETTLVPLTFSVDEPCPIKLAEQLEAMAKELRGQR